MNCLKKMPSIVDKSSIKKVCVDDFARKKRVAYGTVTVDLETHKIVNIIPSRDTEDVKRWLAEYPNIEVVSRDGAQIYAHTAKKSHPEAIQVSDRFHLIKGLSDAMSKFIIREFPARLEIKQVSVQSKEMTQLLNVNNRAKRIKFAHEKKMEGMTVAEIALILHASLKTIEKYLNINLNTVVERKIKREQEHELAMEQKQKDVDEARQMAKQGIPIEQIAKVLHRGIKTIQNYLNPEYSVENGHYHVRIPRKLSPYEQKFWN